MALSSVLLAGLPPGDYKLYAIVYAWETGERLMGRAGDATGDRLLVAQFSIS